MTDPSSPKIRTWKVIAAELDVSLRQVQRLARRHFDPLQVFSDHVGVFTTRAIVDEWMKRQVKSLEQRLAGQSRKAS